MPQKSAFLSYAHTDSEWAREVETTLRALGLHTQLAGEAEAAARESPRAIGEAISSHDLLVLLWSEHASKSSLVEFAWNTAIALRKTIIPCLLDETPLEPSLADVPGVALQDLSHSVPKILSSPAESGTDPDQGLHSNLL